jgi:hypothetical protein
MAQYTIHTFRPSETIDAVIRLKGRHDLTHEELSKLRTTFDELNGKIVPRQGQTYKIPLPFEVTDDMGNVVDTTPAPVLDAEGNQIYI